MGFLGGLLAGAGSLISRFAGPLLGGLGTIAKGIVKPFFGSLMSSPVGTAIKTVGPTVASWVGEDAFNGAMRQFGNKIQDRYEGSKLSSVFPGMNVGDVYYNGMRRVYDFVKTGGQNMVDYVNGPGGGPGQMQRVEKMPNRYEGIPQVGPMPPGMGVGMGTGPPGFTGGSGMGGGPRPRGGGMAG